MAEVHVTRYSNNPQSRTFGETMLPERFWADNENGVQEEYHFLDESGKPCGYIIDAGGSNKFNTDRGYNNHNYRSLMALVRNPKLIPPGCEFRVVNVETEAESLVAKRTKKYEAIGKISSQMNDKQFVNSMARRLGLEHLASRSSIEVLDFVQNKAEYEPELVLDILNSVYQKELFELDKARETGVITMRGGFFYYGQQQLGVSEGGVIDYFHRFPDVFADIIRRNAIKFGDEVAKYQDERIAQMMAGTSADIVEADPMKPLVFTQTRGDQFPVDTDGAFKPSYEIEQLVNKGRETGILMEVAQNDKYPKHIAFNGIPLLVPEGGPTGYVKNAQAFLSMPANKGLKTKITQTVEQAQKNQLVAVDD